jgi:hypothetical protein
MIGFVYDTKCQSCDKKWHRNNEGRMMNQNEYAIHRGVTRQYINRLIKLGKLTGAVKRRGGRIVIDPAKADAIIARTRDPGAPDPAGTGHVEKRAAREKKPKKAKVVDFEQQKETVQSSGISLKMDFGTARTLKEQYLAALKKLEYEEKRGQAIDGEQARRKMFDIARRFRDQCLAIADRCAPVVAVESDQHKCKELLLAEIRFILRELKEDIDRLH